MLEDSERDPTLRELNWDDSARPLLKRSDQNILRANDGGRSVEGLRANSAKCRIITTDEVLIDSRAQSFMDYLDPFISLGSGRQSERERTDGVSVRATDGDNGRLETRFYRFPCRAIIKDQSE